MDSILSGIKERATKLLILILVCGFGSVACRLFYLHMIMGQELSEKAVDQQLSDTLVSAKRGTIYDRNGNVLASSASVWKVILAPAYFENDNQRHYVSQGLAEILGLDESDVFELASKSESYYQTVKRKVESDERDKVLAFIDKLSDKYERLSNVIVLEEDFKRYYPYNDFAASVIGFTGSDGQGLAGIEYQYDSYLTGVSGRIVTENNGWGTTMPFEYQQKEDAKDGNSLVLTIDETVQHFMEKYLKQGIVDYKVAEGAVAICMDVKNGEILGMAVENSFDPNNPYVLASEDAQKEVDNLTGTAKEERLNELLAKSVLYVE